MKLNNLLKKINNKKQINLKLTNISISTLSEIFPSKMETNKIIHQFSFNPNNIKASRANKKRVKKYFKKLTILLMKSEPILTNVKRCWRKEKLSESMKLCLEFKFWTKTMTSRRINWWESKLGSKTPNFLWNLQENYSLMKSEQMIVYNFYLKNILLFLFIYLSFFIAIFVCLYIFIDLFHILYF